MQRARSEKDFLERIKNTIIWASFFLQNIFNLWIVTLEKKIVDRKLNLFKFIILPNARNKKI